MRIVKGIVTPKATGITHSAAMIFFHGSGDTGPNVRQWILSLVDKDIDFPHIKILYPSAPSQPYTLLNGQPSTVWFDRRALSLDAEEDKPSLERIYKGVHELIQGEVDLGIPTNRIIVGGFSMGGTLAMHAAYHLNIDLAGVFTASSFLNRNSIVYDSLKNRTTTAAPPPELIMFHGSKDEVVPLEWGQDTYKKLTSLGVKSSFTLLDGAEHELTKRELLEILLWIGTKLPPLIDNVE